MTRKVLLFIVSALFVLSAASCMKDNDYKPLTKEEKAYCFQQVGGSHIGKLLYSAVNPKNPMDNIDTLDVSWNIKNDSTLVIDYVPVKIFAEKISDKSLKEAVSAQNDVMLECRIGFQTTSPVQFLVNPKVITYDNLTYDGVAHKVQIYFYANYSGSYGAYNPAKNIHMVQIVEAAVYVDEKLINQLSEDAPFLLYSGSLNDTK